MNIHERIKEFDFDTATYYDLSILVEQIFTHHNPLSRDGGPVMVMESVLRKYDEAIRKRAAPELYAAVRGRSVELRSTMNQFETLLTKLERESGAHAR